MLFASFAVLACSTGSGDAPPDAGRKEGVTISPQPPFTRFCDLPGSVRYTAAGQVTVTGGADAEKVAFLQLPLGFCAHYFANVGNTRQLRFAPGGELFVASPTRGTTGGGYGGKKSVVILPDDDRDGTADETLTFLSDLPSTQGMLFASDRHFYYQDDSKILRRPYESGDRLPSEPVEQMADISVYASSLHWPKTLDQADDGTIYVANGGDQLESCDPSRPFHGGVLTLDGSHGGGQVAKGFRNPIAIRCHRGHNQCFAVELSMDYTAQTGGREKLVPIRAGDDWGFPCCFARNVPAVGVRPTPDCSAITPEEVSFVIGDTPFGLDFEDGRWPAPYTGSAFVPVHGVYGTWTGARVVVIAVDPATGMPRAGSNLPTVSSGAMDDFATGWDDGKKLHGRPAAVAFAPDGRLFIGNDNNGDILWIAPLDLTR